MSACTSVHHDAVDCEAAGWHRDNWCDACLGTAPAHCRLCGCTEDQACPGGCWWVPDPEGDLCSACAPEIWEQLGGPLS